MIQMTDDSIKMLLDRVKEGMTVRIEFTPEQTTIEVEPWSPYQYRPVCPYKEDADD